jgi:ribosome-associated heat shock protein Hsp15
MASRANADDATEAGEDERTRIDKWLWAARFFKTRSIAADAVDSGRILVNGAKVKPARALKLDDQLEIRTLGALYVVHVKELSAQRGPAAQAARLYEETEQSKQARAQASLEHVAHPDAYSKGRPTKRVRRVLHKVRGQPF